MWVNVKACKLKFNSEVWHANKNTGGGGEDVAMMKVQFVISQELCVYGACFVEKLRECFSFVKFLESSQSETLLSGKH